MDDTVSPVNLYVTDLLNQLIPITALSFIADLNAFIGWRARFSKYLSGISPLKVLICQVTCYVAEDQLFQWTEKVCLYYKISRMTL